MRWLPIPDNHLFLLITQTACCSEGSFSKKGKKGKKPKTEIRKAIWPFNLTNNIKNIMFICVFYNSFIIFASRK